MADDLGVLEILDTLVEAFSLQRDRIAAATLGDENAEDVAAVLRDTAGILEGVRQEVEAAADRFLARGARRRFTLAGWASERARIAERFAVDEVDGLAAWLSTWAQACAEWRIEAIERLTGPGLEPPGSLSLVAERLTSANLALRQRAWRAAEPVLSSVASAVALGDRPLVTTPARGSLHVLLARMALAEADEAIARDPSDVAAGTLDRCAGHLAAAADLLGAVAAVLAGRAELAARRGQPDEHARLAAEIRQLGAADLASLVVLVAADGPGPAVGDTQIVDGVRAVLERQDLASEAGRLVTPLPAALCLALGGEAIRRQDLAAAECALAMDQTGWGDDERASAAELMAGLVALRGGSDAAVGDAMLEAARIRIWSDPPAFGEACRLYEEALRRRPDDLEVGVELADAERLAASNEPLDAARPALLRALERVLLAQRQGVVGLDGWSFLTEAGIRSRLAREASSEAATHLWSAGLAVLRALAYDLADADRWAALDNILRTLGAHHAAAVAARHAASLAPDDIRRRVDAAGSLANVGRYEEALALLDQVPGSAPECTASDAVRGYLLVLTGRPSDAVELLTPQTAVTAEDPVWWAWYALVDALSLAGDDERARSAASELWRLSQVRHGETAAMVAGAFAALELGHPGEAARLAHDAFRLDPLGETSVVLGTADILEGRSDDGLAAMLRGVARMAPIELDGVERRYWPRLERLAARLGVETPPFAAVGAAIGERRRSLESDGDLRRELTPPNPAMVSPELVEVVTAWAAAAIAVADGNVRTAEAEIERARAADPSVPEIDRFAAATAAGQAGPGAPTSAPVDAPAEPVEPGDQPAAPPEPPPITLELPSSWFSGLEHPEEDHPILIRYLREARDRTGGQLPSVLVRDDQLLEPDRYRVLLNGRLVDEGSVDLTSLSFLAASAPLLERGGNATTAPVASDLLAGLVASPAGALPPTDGAVALLTMTPDEVVVRRLAAVVSRPPA